MVKSLEEDDGEHKGWRCDGCGKRQPLNQEAALIMHGQTTSGGMSISFCGKCKLEREKWEQYLQEAEFTSHGRSV